MAAVRTGWAWFMALLGGFFAVAGAVLLAAGGSPYYVLVGIAMVASGALWGRGRESGRTLYLAVWVATLLWTIWESGFDWLQWVPRLLAPTVLLVLFYAPALPRLLRGRRGRVAAVTALVALFGVALTPLLAPGRLVAQEAHPAAAPVPAIDPGLSDWQQYGGTLAGTRYSALGQINRGNVTKLELAWTQRTGDLPDRAESVEHKREYHSEATPIHIGDRLFTCTPHSVVQAIDATTGRTLWTWKNAAPREGNGYLVCRGVSYFRAPAGTACPDRIFAPTFDAKLVALDANTGRPCAGFGKGGQGYIDLRENMGVSGPSDQISTSPPVIANGRLIIGERITDNINRDIPSGVVRAYDPVSGAAVWAWDVGRSQDAIKPLPPGQIYTRGTPNVWGAMTADPANGLVYLGTGNASPDYWIGWRRPFDDRFGTSIVALEIATGKLRWMRQLVHRDMWDMDIPVGPSLFDWRAPDGRMIPALIQTTKMGQVYFLNRLTGAPITPIVEKPAPQQGDAAGQRLSPTQPWSVGFPSFTPPAPSEKRTWGATPIDQLFCRLDIRRSQGRGIYQPTGLTPIIGHPAFDGVTDWGGGAIDPVRQTFVVNTMEMPFKIWLMRRDDPRVAPLLKKKTAGENARSAMIQPQYNTPYVAMVKAWLGIFGAPCVAPPWGHLTAVNLSNQKVTWREVLGTARDTGPFGTHLGVPVKTGVPSVGGSIVTAGGIAFIGATTDQYLRAFDMATGKVLWKARLPAGAQATPMTYQGRDGRQYVVITAGGHGALGTRYGDYTLAYALPKG